MSDAPLPPGLHVVLGDSAAGTFRRVFDPPAGRLDIDRDVLSCGSTPACASLAAWEAMRMRFWHDLVPLGPEEPAPPAMDLPERAQHLQEAALIHQWAGTGLSEQLSLAFTIYLAEQDRPAPGKFHVVQYDKLPASAGEVYGLGMLGEKAMQEHPSPREMTASELQDYRDAWAAVTSPDPAGIEQFAASHPTANRFLRRAMQLLLRRFPDRQTGLNFWDRELLAGTPSTWRKAARIVGDTIVRLAAECDPVGDFFLFGRLLGLGHRAEPLIEIAGDGMNMRYTEVKLTRFGLDVLAGRASNYPANAIEDWAAGVRLSSREGALWFNDAGRLVRG